MSKGGGKIAVEFTVYGTYIMDEIGAHRITVYKMLGSEPNAGTDDMVKTFYYTSYPDMMSSGLGMYKGSVELTVESGDYYAVLEFYASLDGGGDWMGYGTDVVTV